MKGFTLIELLVVVIIIGILSAIALPQYELVVEKSRAAEAMINAKAIQDACQRHLQEYPDDDCDDQTKIADVQLKGGTWKNGNCFLTKNFSYEMGNVQGATGISFVEVCRQDAPTECTADNALYCIDISVIPQDGGRGVVDTTSCDGDYEQVCKLFTDL